MAKSFLKAVNELVEKVKEREEYKELNCYILYNYKRKEYYSFVIPDLPFSLANIMAKAVLFGWLKGTVFAYELHEHNFKSANAEFIVKYFKKVRVKGFHNRVLKHVAKIKRKFKDYKMEKIEVS